MITTIILSAIVILIISLDHYGNKLGEEQDFRVYEQNEHYRKLDGKSPIPWTGSMKRYCEDCEKADK